MTELGIAILTLASLPPYVVGYGTGAIVRVGAWVVAAFRSGYHKGRGL